MWTIDKYRQVIGTFVGVMVCNVVLWMVGLLLPFLVLIVPFGWEALHRVDPHVQHPLYLLLFPFWLKGGGDRSVHCSETDSLLGSASKFTHEHIFFNSLYWTFIYQGNHYWEHCFTKATWLLVCYNNYGWGNTMGEKTHNLFIWRGTDGQIQYLNYVINNILYIYLIEKECWLMAFNRWVEKPWTSMYTKQKYKHSM